VQKFHAEFVEAGKRGVKSGSLGDTTRTAVIGGRA
jgi:hypothetical protein